MSNTVPFPLRYQGMCSVLPQLSIEPEHLITIPFGLLVLCDTPFEAVVDTVCWPWDSYISDKRKPSPQPPIPQEEVVEDF